MNIIGISSHFHDSAACLMRDGVAIAAAQEERFTRRKHDASFPINALEYCLREGGIDWQDVDLLAYYERPDIKRERQEACTNGTAGAGVSSESADVEGDGRVDLLRLVEAPLAARGHGIGVDKLIAFRHHESHAAAAYFASPFRAAAILTVDGVGEWETTALSYGHRERMDKLDAQVFPHSLGLFYAAFTDYCGFRVNSGEYKLMGLAAYGEPTYRDLLFDRVVSIDERAFPTLDQRYFDFSGVSGMASPELETLLPIRRRRPNQRITQGHLDRAASVQRVTEEIMFALAERLRRLTAAEYLCLGGGVALNCVVNGKLARSGLFKNIWVQPAAGDAGCALGAAYLAHVARSKGQHAAQPLGSVFLGPGYSDDDVRRAVERSPCRAELEVEHLLSDAHVAVTAARDLRGGLVVGWFQGRMEFGPRALGARSILANPLLAGTQSELNQKIKFRESFRPFAPIVRVDDAARYFEWEGDSPHMLFTATVRQHLRKTERGDARGVRRLRQLRSTIPAVTHVDYSARLQTVAREQNPLMYELLSRFGELTGHPILVNTSYNVRGEPLVCDPDDALRCFCGTYMDVLYAQGLRITKRRSGALLSSRFKEQFEQD